MAWSEAISFATALLLCEDDHALGHPLDAIGAVLGP